MESFVLHLRNLIDFFYVWPGKPSKSTDVVAADFMDKPGEWLNSLPDALKAARDRANQEMSHLTSNRKNEGDPGKAWNMGELCAEVLKTAQLFVSKASPNKLHPKVRNLFTNIKYVEPPPSGYTGPGQR